MEEMTRASATPARGASLPPSERTTPVQRLGERSGSCGNLRACDFGEKIRQLEAIGNRLRGEVDVILHDNHHHHAVHAVAGLHDQKILEEADHAAFRELTDISHEQHAIEAMKSQLEQLQHRLREPRVYSGLPPRPASPAPRVTRNSIVLPNSALERELREARDRCAWLEAQLQEYQQQLALESDRHRITAEELKARLYEMQTEADKNARLREEEQRQNAEISEKLRDSLQELQDANREQERTLLETNSKLDAAQQNHYVLESTLSQIRSLLQGLEQRRGRLFFDSDPVAKQSVSLLAHTLERYIQETECELDSRVNKFHQIEQSLEEQKRAAQLHREDLERTWKDRLHTLSMESDAKQSDLKCKESAARRRAEDAEAQVRSLRDALEESARRSAEQAREAEQRLAAARSDLENARSAWQEKRLGLEAALDAAQRETAAARTDKEQNTRQAVELEANLQRTKAQLTDVQAVLDEERRLRTEESARLARMERQLEDVEKELEMKTASALALDRAMETLREETAREIARVGAERRHSLDMQTRALSDRLAVALSEKKAACAELEKARSEVDAAKRTLDETAASEAMLKIQLESYSDEKNHLQNMIGNRSAEVERLTAERDFYFRCLDEKTEEVSLLKAEKQRLVVQLEDKMADVNSLHAVNRRGDFQQSAEELLASKERQLEDLVAGREQLLRKLKAKEKAMREAEAQRERFRAEAVKTRSEAEAVLRERSQLYEELRESRKEALQLGQELDKAREGGSEREMELQQKVQELTCRFHSLENDVRSAKPAKGGRIGTRLMRDGPAGGATKSQMESVKARLRELEGRAASVETERKRLKAENDRLCRLLQRVTGQNEKLSGELEYYVTKAQQLRDQLAAVEADRERLARDCEEARLQVEGLEEQAAKAQAQASGLAQRLDAVKRASVSAVTKPEPGEAGESHEMRAMLADVRAILSSHARPFAGDQRSSSPVHSLLLDRNAM